MTSIEAYYAQRISQEDCGFILLAAEAATSFNIPFTIAIDLLIGVVIGTNTVLGPLIE